jgi:hypothetical protein
MQPDSVGRCYYQDEEKTVYYLQSDFFLQFLMRGGTTF